MKTIKKKEIKKKVKIKLKKKEEKTLESLIKKGSNKARTLTRARVLLLSSEGKSSKQVRDHLGMTYKTIQNIKERYLSGGLEEALYDRPRPGAPKKFEGKQRAELTALACSDAPEGHACWSLQLLANKAVELGIVDSISGKHVGRILKKTN